MGGSSSHNFCALKHQETDDSKSSSKGMGKNRVQVQHSIEDTSSVEEDEKMDKLLGSPPGELTEDEKALIKSTWAHIESDVETVGPMTFVNVFEMHPTLKDEFIPFKSIDVNDEKFNKVLRNHGLKVLNTIRKMISRIEEPDKMLEMASATGSRHGCYNAEARLIDVMCPHFVKAMQGSLGDAWSHEANIAYTHLFSLLAYHMKKALIAAQKNPKQ